MFFRNEPCWAYYSLVKAQENFAADPEEGKRAG
jgi:hypothetical protein